MSSVAVVHRCGRYVRAGFLAASVMVGACHEGPGPTGEESGTPARISGPLVAIATSGAHTCAVAQAGVIYCWGDGRDGQLGNASRESSLVPVRVGGPPLVALSAGAGLTWPEYSQAAVGQPLWSTTCGRTADGSGYCWGYYGAVGLGLPPSPESPIPLVGAPQEVAGEKIFRSVLVAPYGNRSVGISIDPTAYDWGFFPVNGDMHEAMRYTRVFAPGFGSDCAISRDGAVLCVGSNRFGEAGVAWTDSLGLPGTTGDGVPVTALDFPGGATMDTLVASMSHVCGLTAAGAAWCWGRNDEGQLGVGTTDSVCVSWMNTHACPGAPAGPRHVLATARFVRISAGLMHTCALADDGTAWCWGRNHEGQLGSPGGDAATPRQVESSLHFKEISAGGLSTCAINTDGAALCWGDNTWGQLGTGDRNESARPARVIGQGG